MDDLRAVGTALEEIRNGLSRIAASNVDDMHTLHPGGCAGVAKRLLARLPTIEESIRAEEREACAKIADAVLAGLKRRSKAQHDILAITSEVIRKLNRFEAATAAHYYKMFTELNSRNLKDGNDERIYKVVHFLRQGDLATAANQADLAIRAQGSAHPTDAKEGYAWLVEAFGAKTIAEIMDAPSKCRAVEHGWMRPNQIAASPQPPVSDGWQGMESAPKDLTREVVRARIDRLERALKLGLSVRIWDNLSTEQMNEVLAALHNLPEPLPAPPKQQEGSDEKARGD